MDTQDPWLLHFTHVHNVRGVAEVGLLADAMRPGPSVECADTGIKQRRRELDVSIGPEGVVADYVPFYFAPRSPMLRRIHGGQVVGYQQGQKPLVYLVTRLSRVIDAGLSWVATDRNAAVATARFVNDAEALSGHVDWEIMKAQYWANTPEDGSRVQRRMAEVLVHRNAPWKVISHIYAYDDEIADVVRRSIAERAHRPPVSVRRHWYF